MASPASDDIAIGEYRPDDEAQVLELLAASVGWVPDAHHAEYFRWKHQQSPFGPSPAWVAVDGDRVVGFRTFMRWEFLQGDRRLRAVRAVDTATHPDYQGRGIFSRLTRHALECIEAEGVDFVFNTPNAKSRPGYLKMGWVDVGTVPVRMRPASPRSAVRMLASRTPAERWSLPTDAGLDARTVLDDTDAIETLLTSVKRPAAGGLGTARSADFLRWRYCGFPPLGYRCLLRSEHPSDGLVVFRLRRRGKAIEAVINDVLLREPAANLRPLIRQLLRSSGADYVLRIGQSARDGLLRLPRQGPALTFRQVRLLEPPPLQEWHLEMGDIELF
jgi:GNAT superfamily N-acetyltransferase